MLSEQALHVYVRLLRISYFSLFFGRALNPRNVAFRASNEGALNSRKENARQESGKKFSLKCYYFIIVFLLLETALFIHISLFS